MKRWLAISVATNFLLLGLFISATRQMQRPVTATGAKSAGENFGKENLSHSKIISAAQDNWRSWLGEIRSAGVPNKVMAQLVAADFENRWEDQQRELQRKYENGDVDADALTTADAQHDAKLDDEMRFALGEDGFRQWDKEKTLRDFNLAAANLSKTESDALYNLRKDLFRQRQDLQDASRKGEIDEADLTAKLSTLQTQYEQQAKTLLGDARYTALTAAPDPNIANLKREVKDLNVDDGQMTALLAAQQQWNQQRGQLNDDKPGYEDQLQATDAARDAAFQKILGTDAFAQMQKQQDPEYQTLTHYANAWQLNDSDINYVYSEMASYNSQVENYRDTADALEAQGRDVDWDGVQKNIQSFSQQTAQMLDSYLGADRFAKLKQNDVFNFSYQN